MKPPDSLSQTEGTISQVKVAIVDKNTETLLVHHTIEENLIVTPKSDSMDSYHTANKYIIEKLRGSFSSRAVSSQAKHHDIQNFPNHIKIESGETCMSSLVGLPKYKLEVKLETECADDFSIDKLDHLTLKERLKMLISTIDEFSPFVPMQDVAGGDLGRKLKEKTLLFDFNKTIDECSIYSSDMKPLKRISQGVQGRDKCASIEKHDIPVRRKRKKTATNSLEVALEEDAPGLLKILLDKGVEADEIKLYGEVDNEDPIDISSIEDSFGDLETVISKLFSQSSNLLKFDQLRYSKVSKRSYCLACLISLIEQTRFLKFRKWPVEWGWCRDLQSFIFVFQRHNRIVLERPEYGYATYFFELVEPVPIDWQVKRLVIAMKLASCSRIALLENRPLLVGKDLTESEAQTLENYGWIPNSGLGSMLHYCDRVVHDMKNNNDLSEWRAKIGRLLMNGFDGGIIVIANPPRKVLEHSNTRTWD